MKKIKSYINEYLTSSKLTANTSYNSSSNYADSGYYRVNRITPEVIDNLMGKNIQKICNCEDALEAARLGMEILKDFINTI